MYFFSDQADEQDREIGENMIKQHGSLENLLNSDWVKKCKMNMTAWISLRRMIEKRNGNLLGIENLKPALPCGTAILPCCYQAHGRAPSNKKWNIWQARTAVRACMG